MKIFILFRNIKSTLIYVWNHPSNKKNKYLALFRVFAWQFKKRIFPRPHDINIFNGMIIRCYPDSPSASLLIYCNESPDYHEMNFIKRYLRPGDSFVDVGANIGVYSLLASSLIGSSGQIQAFEPGQKARSRLHENITLNELNNLQVHDYAIGESEGYVNFLTDMDTTNRMLTAIDDGKPSTLVPLVRMDDVLITQFALGKIDIEGAELLAFRGAKRLLAEANPPVWLIEINDSLRDFGFTEHEFKNWLLEHGYELALYDADLNELNFTYPEPWLHSQNVFAIAKQHKHQIAQRCGAHLIN